MHLLHLHQVFNTSLKTIVVVVVVDLDGNTRSQEEVPIVSDAKTFLKERGSKVLQNIPVAKTRKKLKYGFVGKALTEDEVYNAVKTQIADHKSNKSKRVNVSAAVHLVFQTKKCLKVTLFLVLIQNLMKMTYLTLTS